MNAMQHAIANERLMDLAAITNGVDRLYDLGITWDYRPDAPVMVGDQIRTGVYAEHDLTANERSALLAHADQADGIDRASLRHLVTA